MVSMEDSGTRGLNLVERIQKTPCARDSLLYGIGGSVPAGLLHFLFTSRVQRSFHAGFAGFMLTTLGSWVYCRYNYAMMRAKLITIQKGIKMKSLYEGTDLDITRRNKEK
ncbi:hypothetical protein DNTS_032722 [Danionella cerebrum]|uniref:Cytochrome c oxidase assembly protein COX20, mitochondrial n=1 Tax=Danionella cerebrum TaxID=2873325 RepID=A0A553NVZ4_9TELE|nr:hypothetical protein DNTS_032722 [Danionella translucida]